MKTQEELNALKNEVEHVSRKLSALTEEELLQVTGGIEISGDLVPGTSGKDEGYNYIIPKPYIE